MRVAVIRALRGLGDLLCVVPALRSIRTGCPNAEVTMIGVPSGRWLGERFPQYLDSWIDLPYWPSIPEADGDPSETVDLLAAGIAGFDLVLQMQGSGGPINELTRLLAINGLAVVHVDRDARLDPSGVVIERRWPRSGHEIERLAGLVRAIGLPDCGTWLEFPEWERDTDGLSRDVRNVLDKGTPLAVVHPGASRADRRWSADGFARVIRELRGSGMTVVVTGAGAEAGLVHMVARASRVHPMEVASAPLGSLGTLLRRASVLVANDTGVAHLGVAVDVPTVVIGTTSDTERWAPLDLDRHGVHIARGPLAEDVNAVVGAALLLARR